VPDLIDSPADAEAQAAVWMVGLGFADAMPTQLSGDSGIDVVSTRAVAQVKFQVAPVGRPALQNLVGAAAEHPGKLRLFFAWKGYTGPAYAFAEQTNIALFSFTISGELVPDNVLAEHLCSMVQQSLTAGVVGMPQVQPGAPAASYEPLPVATSATAPGGLASWFAQRHPVHIATAVLLLAAVVFFAIFPDVLVTLLAYLVSTAVALFLIWYGFKLTFAPSRGRGRSRSRRRR